MEADWSVVWNPLEPIELLFNQLKDFYVLSAAEKLAYTQDQMIDNALTAIHRTGLYPTAILEYQAFATKNKNWAEFKTHFAEEYMVRPNLGKVGETPTMAPQMYMKMTTTVSPRYTTHWPT